MKKCPILSIFSLLFFSVQNDASAVRILSLDNPASDQTKPTDSNDTEKKNEDSSAIRLGETKEEKNLDKSTEAAENSSPDVTADSRPKSDQGTQKDSRPKSGREALDETPPHSDSITDETAADEKEPVVGKGAGSKKKRGTNATDSAGESEHNTPGDTGEDSIGSATKDTPAPADQSSHPGAKIVSIS
jgi:hypothetical protein